MSWPHIKTTAILLILGTVTAAFYWLTNDEGERKKSEFLSLVRHINELNAKVDAEVYSIHYGMVNDFDRLTSLVRQLQDAVTPWSVQSADLDCLELWECNKQLFSLLHQKRGHVEDFKSTKSVMRNSLASFVRLATGLLSHEEGQAAESLKQVANVRWRGLEFALSMNRDNEKSFRSSLASLENYSISQPPDYRKQVDLLQVHCEVLLSRGVGLEKTIREITDQSPELLLDHQLTAVSTWAADEKLTSARFRLALFVSTVLLILYCGKKMSQVQKMMRQLAESNTLLDHRVASRTRELQESEERFQQIASNLDDVLFMTSDDGSQMIFISAAYQTLWGRSCDSLYKQPGDWVDGIHPDDRARVVEAFFERAAEGGFNEEYRVVRSDGSFSWVHATGFPIRNETGEAYRIAGVVRDITARKTEQAERDQMQAELLVTSRQAGMAEVATGVLHNVGNVLNSVNVSANIAVERIKASRVGTLSKASSVIAEQADLADFFSSDPRGKTFPRLLQELAKNLGAERDAQLIELLSLVENIDHIKEIVSMQQAYAKVRGTTEMVDLVKLFEEALRIDDAGFARHKVEVVRQFSELPPILTEKHSVMQILLNLLKNAKQSVNEFGGDDKTLTLTLSADEDNINIQVRDNGIGIEAGNLSKIFTHGFTTKSSGHGFGLHSCALTAQKLGGSLSVHSDGSGHGATFTLRLPTSTESLCNV